MAGRSMGIGVYIHVPFCRAKCPYCDFNSYAGKERLIEPYIRALTQQIGAAGFGEKVDTVYFGGGNPAMMGPALIEVLEAVVSKWEVGPDAEISLEMNPEDAQAPLLKQLRQGGFNRISFGWQSLDDGRLKVLGRSHSAAEAADSLKAARYAGFDNVGVDLIYGIPGQTTGQWEEELKKLILLKPDHISTYALTLAEGTPLYERVKTGRGSPGDILPGQDVLADMYQRAREITAAAGYKHYELSNFAFGGLIGRHNMNYWLGGNYLGFGAGAHSHANGRRWWNPKNPEDYIRSPSSIAGEEALTPARRLGERIILGLRLVDGIEPDQLEKEYKIDFDKIFGSAIQRMRATGLMAPGPKLALSEKGLFLANEVMVVFV